jgi:hypothetical protein
VTPMPPDEPRTNWPRSDRSFDRRPWWRKKRYVIPLGVFLLLLFLATTGGDGTVETQPTAAEGDGAVEVVTEMVTETATETVTETVTEAVTETVTERPTGQLNNLRRRLRERDQTIRQLRRRIRSLRNQVAVAPDPQPEPDSGGNCHPSYQPCVPIASDVDCIGGSGNGPEYTGQVTVVGPDEYGLDSDGDGIGCE